MPEWLAPYMPVAPTALSALVSAFVAWVAARLSVRTELQKLRLGVQQKLLEQLVAARLVVYPDLYSLLSELLKTARLAVEEPNALRALLGRINSWDSKNSILLGPHTTNVCYAFRRTLAEAASTAAEVSVNETRWQKTIETLFSQAEQLELALRSDLGIYGIEVLQRPGILRTPLVRKF
jgi:hypothetical protein